MKIKTKEQALKYVHQNPYNFKFLNNTFREDKDIAMESVKFCGKMLKYVEGNLKNDPDICLAAIKADANAYQWFGNIQNEEFYVEASKYNPHDICVLALKHGIYNRDIVLRNAKENNSNVPYLLHYHKYDEALNDEEIILYSIKSNKKNIRYVKKSFLESREFVLKLVSLCGSAIQYVDPRFKSDIEVVMTAIKSDGCALEYVSEEFRKNKDFVLEAIKNTPKAYEYIDSSLKDDKSIALEVAKLPNGINFLDKKFYSDKDIILAAVKADGMALRFADKELKKDAEVVLTAISQNGMALGFADDIFKNNLEYLIIAMSNNYKACKFAGEELTKDYKSTINSITNRIQYNEKQISAISFIIKYYDKIRKDRLGFESDSLEDSLCRRSIKLWDYINEFANESVNIYTTAYNSGKIDIATYKNLILEEIANSEWYIQSLIFSRHEKEIYKLINDNNFLLDLIGVCSQATEVNSRGSIYRFMYKVLNLKNGFIVKAGIVNPKIIEVWWDKVTPSYDIFVEDEDEEILRMEGNLIPIILKIANENAEVLKYLPPQLKYNIDIILAAVKQDAKAITYLCEPYRNDRDFMTEAVKVNPSAILYASKEIKTNVSFIINNVNLSNEIVEQLCIDNQDNDNFLLSFATYNNKALQFLLKHSNNERVLMELRQANNEGAIDIIKNKFSSINKALEDEHREELEKLAKEINNIGNDDDRLHFVKMLNEISNYYVNNYAVLNNKTHETMDLEFLEAINKLKKEFGLYKATGYRRWLEDEHLNRYNHIIDMTNYVLDEKSRTYFINKLISINNKYMRDYEALNNENPIEEEDISYNTAMDELENELEQYIAENYYINNNILN